MLIAANPFVNAYLQSDWFGKGIFWGLFILSVSSWILLLHKTWLLFQVRRLSLEFSKLFCAHQEQPLHFHFQHPASRPWPEVPHPFFEIYKTLKKNALQIIDRNSGQGSALLSGADLDFISSQVEVTASLQCKPLDKNLFILSTIATLAPFLGLLGTVWGILMTFSQFAAGFSSSNAMMLSGLSMALATTVIGLVVAIPALVSYSMLRNANREYKQDIRHFAQNLLGALEMQYRQG